MQSDSDTAELPPVGELTALERKGAPVSGAPDLPPHAIEPLPPAPVVIARVLAQLPVIESRAGELTTEFKLARQTSTMAMVVVGLGAVCELLPMVKDILPDTQVAQVAGHVLVIAGMALKLLNSCGYGLSRAMVKQGEARAQAEVQVAKITQAAYAGEPPVSLP